MKSVIGGKNIFSTFLPCVFLWILCLSFCPHSLHGQKLTFNGLVFYDISLKLHGTGPGLLSSNSPNAASISSCTCWRCSAFLSRFHRSPSALQRASTTLNVYVATVSNPPPYSVCMTDCLRFNELYSARRTTRSRLKTGNSSRVPRKECRRGQDLDSSVANKEVKFQKLKYMKCC